MTKKIETLCSEIIEDLEAIVEATSERKEFDVYAAAEAIAEAINADETGRQFHARIWQNYGKTRVYVSRDLSRGWQDVGYCEISKSGIEQCFVRARGTMSEIIKGLNFNF